MSKPSRAQFAVVVHVALQRADHLYLLRRANTSFMDGYHALPGGHQEHGESVEAAARRECQEETGVELIDCRLMAVLPYRSGRHQGINFVFSSWDWRGAPGIAEPHACDLADFYGLDDLPAPLTGWVAELLPQLRDAHAPVLFRADLYDG